MNESTKSARTWLLVNDGWSHDQIEHWTIKQMDEEIFFGTKLWKSTKYSALKFKICFVCIAVLLILQQDKFPACVALIHISTVIYLQWRDSRETSVW